jgi:hypothetical protein
MTLRSISILALTVGITLAALHRPAAACSAPFETPFDLFDEAVTVAVMKVDKVSKTGATLSFVEALKGSPDAKLKLDVGLRSTCSPSIGKKGMRGVVYLAADGHMIGLYDGFESRPAVVDALRTYAAATTAAGRAAPLLELAVGRDHSPSYEAAYALANRIDLVQALDTAARERVIARLAKIGTESTLILVGARFHDPRVAALHDKRRFDAALVLDGVLAGALDAENDTGRLAALIARTTAPVADRVAAMERCEQVHGTSLARFTIYSYPGEEATAAAWTARAEACRRGSP